MQETSVIEHSEPIAAIVGQMLAAAPSMTLCCMATS